MSRNPIDPNVPWDDVDIDKISDIAVALIEKRRGVTPGFVLIGVHPASGKLALSTNMENNSLAGLLTQLAISTAAGDYVDSRDVPGETKQ